jgi:hypothetical protein
MFRMWSCLSGFPGCSQVGEDGDPQLCRAIRDKRYLLCIGAHLGEGEIGQRWSKELILLDSHSL